MIVSNVQLMKGMIVIVGPHPQKAFDHRPMLVVSNQCRVFNDVQVCTLTSKTQWPGIPIRLWNYHSSTPLGGVEESRIQPYSINTVNIDQVVRIIGALEPQLMKEVDRAIEYHRGLSDVVPDYYKEVLDGTFKPPTSLRYQNYVKCSISLGQEIERDLSPTVPEEEVEVPATPKTITMKENREPLTLTMEYRSEKEIKDRLMKWKDEMMTATLNRLSSTSANTYEDIIHCIGDFGLFLIGARVLNVTDLTRALRVNRTLIKRLRSDIDSMAVANAAILNQLLRSGQSIHLSGLDMITIGTCATFRDSSCLEAGVSDNMILMLDGIRHKILAQNLVDFSDLRMWSQTYKK